MGLELTIAMKHDPGTGSGERAPVFPAPYASITLNGTFDQDDSRELLATITNLFAQSADSILVFMEKLLPVDIVCLQSFAAGLMSLRKAGRHVQVATCDARLHAKLDEIANSRDWLVASTSADSSGARRAIHLDGSVEAD